MTEERRVQLVAEVDTTRTRAGFNEIGQQANTMAQQVTRAGEQAERAVTAVGSGAATSSRSVDSASRSIIGSIQRTTVAMEAGGRATSQYYELLARQRGIDPNTLTPYLTALRNVEQAQARTGASSAQIANAMRMVPAQLSDIAVQLAGGQSPLMVLMQQGSQLRDSFGSIPATIRGVGASLLGLVNPYTVLAGAVGALAFAYNEGSKEADAYNAAIIMTGNAAGTSGSQLAAYASEISNAVGTQAEAAKALAALTATGQVGSDNLKQFGQVAVEVQKYIGRSVDDTVKDFAELGKSPVEASLKLSESYHYLTSAVYEQIKALQDQGKNDEAAEVAQKAYATAFEERAAKMKDNLGAIESAWMSAKDSASKAWDAFLGVGRKKTPQQELAEVQSQIALAQQAPSTGTGDRSDAAEMRRSMAAGKLTELQKRESELKWQVEKDEWDRRQAEISEKLRQAGLEWDKIMDTTLSKEQLREKEIAAARQKGEDAGASDADIAKAINKINQKYSAVNNVTLTQLENSRNLAKEKMAGESTDLDTQYKLQLIGQEQYYAKKRDMQVKEIDLEIPILKKQAEIAGGKEDQSAREKALGDLQVLMQRRKNIIEDAANSIKVSDYERQKSIDEVVTGWDRLLEAERNTISQEIALFGQSDQARKVYLAQLQIELELQKKIQDRKDKGLAYTAEEIAAFRARAEADKAQKAENLNQLAALAAANQLRRDNLKFSAEYIADADLRARRIMEIDAEQWQYLINNTAEGSEARKKILEQFDQWVANRQMQPVLDRWKGVIDNLDNNFQEGFRDMLTGGQNVWSSFAKSISNTLKTSLADALYQVFVKKYVVQVVTGLAGAISGPATAAALSGNAVGAVSGASSAIGAAQMASNLYGFATGGMTLAGGLGTGFMGSVAGGLTGAGAGSGLTSSLGLSIGNGILDVVGPGISASIASGLGAVATALPWVGGAVAVASLWKSAFGHGDTEVQGQGIRGTVSATSLAGKSYQELHQDGGWFSSDRDWEDKKDFTGAMVKQFTSGLLSLENAAAGFASSLGVQADSISTYSKSFDLKLTGDQTKDQQIIADFFAGVGDEIANKLVPNLTDFAKSGEAASATLERLAGDFKGTDQIAQLLGRSASTLFGATGIESAKARESLIDFAGGLSTLSSEASFFNQNFLTDAERIKPVAEALDKALGSLGLETIPTTRDQFKSLINSLIDSGAAATDAGGKQLTSLLALSEAFAQVHPETAAKALQERQSLQDEYDQMTLTSTQLLGKQRDALADSNKELFDQIQALKAQATAIQSMKDAASTLLGGVDSAFTALQKVVAREKTAVQASVTAQTAAVSKLQTLSQALRSTLDSLKSPDQKAAERASAQAQIRAALAIAKAGGALPTADSLKNALSAVTRDSSDQFATYQDYLRDLYQTQNDISQLGDITDDQLSVAEKSLDALQDQLKTLDDQLEAAQEQVDILKGIDTNGLSLLDAMRGLTTAILQAQSNPIVAATGAINGAYQQYLGRTPDAPGLEWWQNAAANGAPVSQIVDGIKGSTEATLNTLYKDVLGRAPDGEGLAFWMKAYGNTMDAAETADFLKVAQGTDEYKKLHPFAVGTNFVPETMPALIHRGERIIPAADNRALMARLASPAANADALAAAVDRLTAQVATQQEIIDRQGDLLRAIAGHTSDTASHLDDVINGRKPIPTEAV